MKREDANGVALARRQREAKKKELLRYPRREPRKNIYDSYFSMGRHRLWMWKGSRTRVSGSAAPLSLKIDSDQARYPHGNVKGDKETDETVPIPGTQLPIEMSQARRRRRAWSVAGWRY